MAVALRGLGARFDGAALRPFEPVAQAADWPALRDWCLQPGRWAVARSDAVDAGARAARVALVLDGSDRLLACGGPLQRLALKLRVKLADALASPEVQASDVWDSGWVSDDDTALAALARFEPRRPSLIAIDGLAPARVQPALHALAAHRAAWRRPVRVLLLGGSGAAWAGASLLPV